MFDVLLLVLFLIIEQTPSFDEPTKPVGVMVFTLYLPLSGQLWGDLLVVLRLSMSWCSYNRRACYKQSNSQRWQLHCVCLLAVSSGVGG